MTAQPKASQPKKCAWCDEPLAPPSTRFCDEHRAEHAAILQGQLRNAERAAERARAGR